MLAPHQIVQAVTKLDPEDRAVIELLARRGMSEDAVAELLNVDAEDVRRRGERATVELGAAMGLTEPNELEELSQQLVRLEEEDWQGRAPADADGPGAAREEQSEPEKVGARGLRGAVAGAVLLAIAVVVVVAVASSGKDGKQRRATTTPATDTAPATDTPPDGGPGPVVTFRRLNSTHGHGTVQLVRTGGGAQLRLRVTGFLRPKGGGYAAWLFNSPSDARELAFARSTSISRDLRLPRDYARYRYVDVSREVTNDPGYSGLNLLRAPLDALTRNGG